MKKIILSATAVLFTLGAFAQTGVGYGLKAGVNLANYKYSPELDTKASPNFHLTGYLDAPISSNFYIQPGISLQGKGAKIDDYVIDGNKYSGKQSTMWIEVPVNAVAKFPTGDAGNLFLGAGPYAAFGVSGKNTVTKDGKAVTDIDDFKFGDGLNPKAFDAGVNFLAGYELSSGLTIGAGYGLGLSNLSGMGGDSKQNSRVLSFSVGFAL